MFRDDDCVCPFDTSNIDSLQLFVKRRSPES